MDNDRFVREGLDSIKNFILNKLNSSDQALLLKNLTRDKEIGILTKNNVSIVIEGYKIKFYAGKILLLQFTSPDDVFNLKDDNHTFIIGREQFRFIPFNLNMIL
jgi:hypothetical protein